MIPRENCMINKSLAQRMVSGLPVSWFSFGSCLLLVAVCSACTEGSQKFNFDWDRKITALGYDAGQKLVVAGGVDSVLLWNFATGESYQLPGSPTYTRALFASGQLIMAGADGRVLRGNPLVQLVEFEYPVPVLVGNDRWFAVATNDGIAVVWDASTGKEHWRYTPKDFRADVVAVGLADDLLIGASSPPGYTRGSMIVAWDLRTKRKKYWIGESNQRGGIISIAGSPEHYAMSAKDRSLVIRRAADGQVVHSLRTESEVPELQFFAGGRYLAVGGWDSALRILDSRQGFREIFKRDYDAGVVGIYASDDCYPVIVGTYSGEIIVEDLREELPGCLPGAADQ